MHVVELLLPVRDNQGRHFEREVFARVAAELTERFGGVTAFTRAPAEGHWVDGGATVADDVVAFEVMVRTLEYRWWRTYREQLEERFGQQELVVRAVEIERL